MVLGLQDSRTTISDRLEDSEVKIFKQSIPIKSREIREERVNFKETFTDQDGLTTSGQCLFVFLSLSP